MALTTVVASGVPPAIPLATFSATPATALGVKPVPFKVSVNAALPAVTVAGEMLVMTGTGDAIVKVTALDAGPDGLARVICAEPG